MTDRTTHVVAGSSLILIGLIALGVALLLASGTALEFSWATALYAGVFALVSFGFLWAGVRLCRWHS
jgi:hypothetical protein